MKRILGMTLGVVGVAVAMGACSSTPDTGAGTGGVAATGGATGGATASGGASGGAVASGGGVATGGATGGAPATPPICGENGLGEGGIANLPEGCIFVGDGNWVDASSNDVGIQGAFYILEDSAVNGEVANDGLVHSDFDPDTGGTGIGESGLEPSEFDSTTIKPCVTGTAAKVSRDAATGTGGSGSGGADGSGGAGTGGDGVGGAPAGGAASGGAASGGAASGGAATGGDAAVGGAGTGGGDPAGGAEGAGGSASADPPYAEIWGGGIGMNLSVASDGTTTTAMAWNAQASGVLGFEFVLSGSAGGADVRFKATQFGLTEDGDFCMSVKAKVGQVTRVLFSELEHQCWQGGTASKTLDTTQLGDIQWQVVTDTKNAYPVTNLCVESVAYVK